MSNAQSRIYLVRVATGGHSWERTINAALAWGKLLVPTTSEDEQRVRAALTDGRVAEWSCGINGVHITPYLRTAKGYEPIFETISV